jgi:putative flippase GtrA
MAQLVRYGLVGGFVTALQALTYWGLAQYLSVHPQLANAAGYSVALVSGFFLHGQVSFRGHGQRDRPLMQALRFFIVSLASLAFNAGWVWLTITMLNWPLWAPIPFMALVTPLLVFMLNRKWVFV